MDPLLHGHNPEQRLVAVHPSGDDRMRLFTRTPEGVVSREEPFFPFFHLSDSTLLEGYGRKYWIKELEGDRSYRFLAAFPRWSEMWDAVRHVLETRSGRLKIPIGSHQEVPELLLRTDPVSQFLMQTGMTLFKGMQFPELHRLQLDIETYSSRARRFSDPARPEDRIILVALSDSRGYREVLDGRKLAEPEMLRRLFAIVRELDCDVLEGHNIFGFDLPYILRRCRLHGVEPDIGREGLPLRLPDPRPGRPDRGFDLQPVDVPGRHVIDTLLLLQSWDASKRKLESHGLKQAARHFGFAREGRVYLDPERLSWHWDHEPDLLAAYALDDVDETRLLSDLLSPPAFHLTAMTPFSYSTAARNGAAAKIESMLLREYLRRRVSVPAPEPMKPSSGGYADVFLTGVAGPVVDVDVESLYPSIMLAEGIAPHSEGLGIFTEMLRALTALRLEAKRGMKAERDPDARTKLDALQTSFKILINSFYGYLGYGRGLFNDSIAADRVTRSGQDLLRSLIRVIGERGGTVIEVDTDGVFFVPPGGARTEEKEAAFVRAVAAGLPPGISLAVNGRYRRMLSYRAKNYAVEGYDGKVTLKGSSLTSRSIERFGRRYVRECVEAVLRGEIGRLHALYVETRRAISSHELEVGEFARTEALRESPEEYREGVASGRRNRSAPYEAALAGLGEWRRGERVSYYITGNDPSGQNFSHCRLAGEWDPVDPDENVPFYLRRLEELSKKFEPFFAPADFRRIFSPEDLFGFSPEGIAVVTKPVEPGGPGEGEDQEEESPSREPTIWLDTGG